MFILKRHRSIISPEGEGENIAASGSLMGASMPSQNSNSPTTGGIVPDIDKNQIAPPATQPWRKLFADDNDTKLSYVALSKNLESGILRMPPEVI